MECDTLLVLICVLLCGLWMIFHSAKALRSGVFVGWYKGTYENYYIYRSETPIYFYWYNTVFSLFGSFMIGLALYLLNGDYHFL
ncbi:DUF2542 family protein [Enterobacter roggenkampii]|uniref:DUF2542 family protein n=1 Tax=Enterobacter roggenkampii TaxID=1812935 RepID=UPI003785382F